MIRIMKTFRVLLFSAVTFAASLHADDPREADTGEIVIETKISEGAKKAGQPGDVLAAPKIVVLDGQFAQIRVTNEKAIALAGRDGAKQEFETGVILNIAASIEGDRILVRGVIELSEQDGKSHTGGNGPQWVELHATRLPFVASVEDGKPFELTCANPKDPRTTLTVQFKAARAPKQPAAPEPK